jgi:hypothetical protein
MDAGMWEMRSAEPDSEGPFGYDGEQFDFCPWCGKQLKLYGTLDPEQNKEEFDKLFRFIKRTTEKSGLVRDVKMDTDNPLKFHIYAEHEKFIPQLQRYMSQKIEPKCEHIDGDYRIHDARKVEREKLEDFNAIPTDFPVYEKPLEEDEIDKILREFEDLNLGAE